MQPRSIFLTLILCVGLLASRQPLRAQSDVPLADGCDAMAQTRIVATSTAVDYARACTAYRACADANNTVDESCQLQAYRVLSEACALENDLCQQTAMLYTSAIQSFLSADVWGADPAIQKQILDGIVQGLTAFQKGDYQAAAQAYALGDTSAIGLHMLPLARAVIDQALNKPADALNELNAGLNAAPADPLLHFVRAQVFGELGASERASIDAELLRQETASSPELHTLIMPLVSQYPFDQSRLHDWKVYPVMDWGGGSGGSGASDQSQTAPFTIRMGLFQDQTVILAVNLSQTNNACYDGQTCPNWITLDGNDGDYNADFPQIVDSGSHIHLKRMGDVWIGSEYYTEFEGSGTSTYLIAPAESADPRADLQGRRCGVISRLHPNMTNVSPYWNPNDDISMFDAPGGTVIAHLDSLMAKFDITGNGECHNDVMWWPVRDDQGTVGWMAENAGQSYLLGDIGNVPLYCPAVPQTRLWIGANGVVAPNLGANELRAQPDVKAAAITTIPAGGAFTVSDGPVCAGGYLWWSVRYQDAAGWTAEGQGDQYWLIPQ